MYINSARMHSRSPTDQVMVGNGRKSDELSSWSGGGMVENGGESNNSGPLYPSVAQRIAVWRNITTETSGAPSECDSLVDHAAMTMTMSNMESPTLGANGYGEVRMTEESNQSFVDHLVAELTSSRKRNKKLALKLANVERQVQQMQIEQRLRDDRLEAMVASRVTDALSALLTDRSTESPDAPHFTAIPQEVTEVKNLQFESSKLLSVDDCQSILAYIRDHGCQLPALDSHNEDDVRPSIRPFTRDVGTETRKCDDEEEKEDGNHQLEVALSNANRELIIENAKLQEKLEESESKLHRAEDEANRLRVELENLKNRNVTALEEENARLNSDLEKLKRRSEQVEAKWEREVYELRAKFQTADEDNFRLAEELQAVRRQLAHQAIDSAKDEELAAVGERAKVLTEENKQLLAKNEELKRLVTVLRRKLSAVNPGGSTSK